MNTKVQKSIVACHKALGDNDHTRADIECLSSEHAKTRKRALARLNKSGAIEHILPSQIVNAPSDVRHQVEYTQLVIRAQKAQNDDNFVEVRSIVRQMQGLGEIPADLAVFLKVNEEK